MSFRRRSLIGLAVVAVVSFAGSALAGDERERCATAAEHGQQLRDDGKYRRARDEILVCARSACPGPIKADCGRWLAELDRDAPTVVFGAKDGDGKDVFDVRVSIDGEPIQTRLDGKPVLVDVGEHKITFVWPSGTVKEERVLVRAGEKSRPITFVERSAKPAVVPAPSPAAPTAEPSSPPSPTKGSLALPLAAAGVGVVAFASFAFFGLSGQSELADLERCKPYCTMDRVDSARTKLIIADISLGVGVVALGVATYMILTRPKVDASVKSGQLSPPPRDDERNEGKKSAFQGWNVNFGPTTGGAVGSVGASF